MKTDVQITADTTTQGAPIGERTLQRFFDAPSTSAANPAQSQQWVQKGGLKRAEMGKNSLANVSLEDDDGEKFDQFKNKKTSYKDELYTTKLDKSKITPELQHFAEKKEKEILNQDANGNVHLAEERLQRGQTDADETGRYGEEEMRYSGVYRPKQGGAAKKENGQSSNGGFTKGASLTIQKKSDASATQPEKVTSTKFVVKKNTTTDEGAPKLTDALLNTFLKTQDTKETTKTLTEQWRVTSKQEAAAAGSKKTELKKIEIAETQSNKDDLKEQLYKNAIIEQERLKIDKEEAKVPSVVQEKIVPEVITTPQVIVQEQPNTIVETPKSFNSNAMEFKPKFKPAARYVIPPPFTPSLSSTNAPSFIPSGVPQQTGFSNFNTASITPFNPGQSAPFIPGQSAPFIPG